MLFFTKMEGLGNDFIFIDDRKQEISDSFSYNDLAKKLCHRNFGIGGDGLIIISESIPCDLQFRIFNSDGSEAQMCGNGMRCFAKYVRKKGITDQTKFTVETLAGTITPEIILNSRGEIEAVRVDMGEPVLKTVDIPFISNNEIAISEEIKTSYGDTSITTVSMGNPHTVIFVDDVLSAPVTTLGPEIEKNSKFPEKTNVEFIEVVSRTELKMKVWERGAGVTLACGTGACAAVVAAILNDKTDNKVHITLDGGPLDIEWDRESNHIFKTGSAELVFEGSITL